jgi:hypothetical protein
MGFGLVMRFTELLQLVSPRNSRPIAISHTAIHYSMRLVFAVTYVFTSCLIIFSMADVPIPVGSRIVTMPHKLTPI